MNDLQELLNYLMNKYHTCNIVLQKGRGRQSRAIYRYYHREGKMIRKIIISPWVFELPEEYQWAELIHEFCHHYRGVGYGHDEKFKAAERTILREFGLSVTGYKRAYWTELKTASSCLIFNRKKDFKKYLTK